MSFRKFCSPQRLLEKKSPASLAQSRPALYETPPIPSLPRYAVSRVFTGVWHRGNSRELPSKSKSRPTMADSSRPPMCASTRDTGSLLTCSFRHFAATSPNIRPRSVAVHTAKAPTVQQTGAAAISAAGGSGCPPMRYIAVSTLVAGVPRP